MFGRNPFSPEPQDDGDLDDAIDRAMLLVAAAAIFTLIIFIRSTYA